MRPRGVHLNYFRKYTPPGRETNCIPRRGQSACNYATSHNSDLLPPASRLHCPCAVVDGGRDPLGSSPFRTRRNERTCKSRFMQTTSRLPARPRVGCTVLLFRVGLYPARYFLYLRTFVRAAALRGRRAHVLQCSPMFSDALRRSSTRSPPTDR